MISSAELLQRMPSSWRRTMRYSALSSCAAFQALDQPLDGGFQFGFGHVLAFRNSQPSNIDLMEDLENATPFELAWPSANSSADISLYDFWPPFGSLRRSFLANITTSGCFSAWLRRPSARAPVARLRSRL